LANGEATDAPDKRVAGGAVPPARTTRSIFRKSGNRFSLGNATTQTIMDAELTRDGSRARLLSDEQEDRNLRRPRSGSVARQARQRILNPSHRGSNPR